MIGSLVSLIANMVFDSTAGLANKGLQLKLKIAEKGLYSQPPNREGQERSPCLVQHYHSTSERPYRPSNDEILKKWNNEAASCGGSSSSSFSTGTTNRRVPVSGGPKNDKFSIVPHARAFWYSLYDG